MTPQRREFFWFLAIALLVLGAGIGLRAPWPADEPRFVLVAKQMWDSGDWLFPHRGHELYADKPPLYFWLLGAAYALVRDWTWAFLLPSLVAAMATLAMTYDLGRRLWSHRAGLWAAIAVLACVQFIYQAKRAQIDPTVVCFITLGVYGIARHVLLGPAWRWFWLGCFAAGLGVISKGVGFLALLALIPYALMRWRGWNGLADIGRGNALRWSAGALAFLAAIALWFVPMIVTATTSGDPEHQAYVNELLFKQTATRYTAAWHHTQPAWYFLEVIAAYWLPFSLALPWLFPRWRDAFRARDARVWLPLGWALLVLAFFSASPGKRDMYILPMLPMVALAAGPYLENVTASRWFRRALLALVIVLGVVFLGAGIAALHGDPSFESKIEAQRGLPPASDTLWWLLALTGAAVLAACAWWRRDALKGAAVALSILVVVLFSGTAVLLDDENSARAVMSRGHALAGDATLGLVAWKEQNLLQAQGPVEEFGFRKPVDAQLRAGIAWMLAAPDERRLFVQQDALGGCLLREHGQDVGTANRRTWWLFDASAVAPACRASTR
ncbi:Dolichyl-phosphate mannosyltransferase [Lysobacter dokdonensis DS-58]|uniref:Dolichyl-phosphate mannosyltransferase n=1 Tax=Lysobacter dokdonensis DS-58 TaxID=1300345 RepID=A0A0A2WCZ9_9GAMM|nr:glycosyltransferase family 39 protein [Lysobacter dokdonensis]KGQ18031.1 Dolichyl-phosphate mannosyltransferase [Lysobacter dokdonensis DS-58]